MAKAKEKGVKFLLPVDNVVGLEYKPDTEYKTVIPTIFPTAGWASTSARRRASCSPTP